MSGNCEKCLKGITSTRFPGVKCGMCDSRFHIKCAEISDEVVKELKIGSTTWLCPDCRSKSNCSIIDDTCDGSAMQNSSNIKNPTLSDLVIILQGMQGQLDVVKNSLHFLCQNLDDMKLTINNLTKDSKYLSNKIVVLEKKSEAQDDKINSMEAQLDQPSQEANKSNVVVCGIPPSCNDIAGLISNVLGIANIQMEKDDLLSIKQMVHNKETVSLLKHAFIVKFKTAEKKNIILNTFRKRKCVWFRELGADYSMYPPNQKILFLHHLTRFQSKLYNAAKNIKNNLNFQFLWCKDNNIYLRKTADSKVHHILSFNDIGRLNKAILSPVPPDNNTSIAIRLDNTLAVDASPQDTL